MKKIIFIFAIVILSLLPLNILHSEGITFIEDDNMYNHFWRDLSADFYSYSSLELFGDEQVLNMMGGTQVPLGASFTFAFQSYFILAMNNKDIGTMPFSYIKLDLKNLEGIFLSDKYGINDRTLRLVFVSLMDGTLGIKSALDSRGSYRRSIGFADIDFDKIPTDDVETFPQGYYYLMTAKTLNYDPKMPSPYVKRYTLPDVPDVVDNTPEEAVFYVKELDELHTIRFTENQHWTLRANLTDDSLLSYDTLEHKAIDTTDYPATPDLMAQKQENDIVRYLYSVAPAKHSGFPGINAYHRTKDGNLVFIKQVSRQLHDTVTYQNGSDRRENRSKGIGYQLFVFNNEGLLLYDTLFITSLAMENIHGCDDGFDALIRDSKVGKYQVYKYNFQGEEISKFDIDFTNMEYYNSIATDGYFTNDNIYFLGYFTINGYSETAYKIIAKYDLQGNFITSTKGDYNNPNVWNSNLRAICVDGDTIYAFGSHYKRNIDENEMAYIAKLHDGTVGISEPTIYTNILLSPNPANNITTLSLDLEKAGDLRITLTNITGQEVFQLHNSFADIGAFTKVFSVADLPSGTYFVCIQLGDNTKYEKLIVK